MLLRPRRAPAPPAPADRVRHVLAATSGGWVPPEDEEAREVGLPVEAELDGWPPQGEQAPVDKAPSEEVPGDEAPSEEVPGDEPSVDEAPPAVEVPQREAVSWQRDGEVSTLRPGAHTAGLLSAFVPAAVAGGRYDPGRRGALALVLVALLGALIAGMLVLRGAPQEVVVPEVVPEVVAGGTPLPTVSPTASAPLAPGQEVVVSVAGEVRRPGLVRLPPGSRVDDAVRAAGGPVDAAAVGLLNLARLLVDGEQVLVGIDPPPGAVAPGQGAVGPADVGPGAVGPAPGGLLDLNAATVGDFDALPGIGPVLAQRLLGWRTENGRFASVEQLREVTGIGEAKYEDLKDKVTV